MRVSTDERAWLIPPSRAIWLPPNLAHAITMKGEVALRTLYINPDLAAPLPRLEQALGVTPLLRELILHILKIGMLHPAQPRQSRLAYLLIDLLTEADREDLSLALPRDRAALAMAERLLSSPAERMDLVVAARAAAQGDLVARQVLLGGVKVGCVQRLDLRFLDPGHRSDAFERRCHRRFVYVKLALHLQMARSFWRF